MLIYYLIILIYKYLTLWIRMGWALWSQLPMYSKSSYWKSIILQALRMVFFATQTQILVLGIWYSVCFKVCFIFIDLQKLCSAQVSWCTIKTRYLTVSRWKMLQLLYWYKCLCYCSTLDVKSSIWLHGRTNIIIYSLHDTILSPSVCLFLLFFPP